MPASRSRTAAESRTERVTTCSQVRPPLISPKFGASETRPRLGLRPNNPQQLAGMRIEPPPSVACAIGSMPAVIAVAEPPLEPPALYSGFQGFRVTPKSRDSEEVDRPNSGLWVLPKMTRPERFKRVTISES